MLGADVVLIDGYNLLNSWRELKQLQEQSLEHARDRLLTMMADYAAFKGFKISVVFDGQGAIATDITEQQLTDKLMAVYTPAAITADSYIERRVYELLRDKKTVFVVTNDWAEQIMILGSGAFRFSVRELREDYLRTRKNIKNREKIQPLNRNELAGRLNKDVLAKLEQLRRGR